MCLDAHAPVRQHKVRQAIVFGLLDGFRAAYIKTGTKRQLSVCSKPSGKLSRGVDSSRSIQNEREGSTLLPDATYFRISYQFGKDHYGSTILLKRLPYVADMGIFCGNRDFLDKRHLAFIT